MGLISYAMDRPGSSEEVRTEFHYDEAEDRVIINRTQDIERTLKGNRDMRNSNDGYTKDRSMKRAARIPLVVIEKIIKEQGWNPMHPNNAERLLQLLDDPEYSHFKTADGKLAHRTKRNYYRGSVSTKLVTGSAD